MNNWNPLVEHIEGTLCEKGLLKETYDFNKDDLVRNFTPTGRTIAENLLKEPEFLRAYLIMAKALFSNLPLEQRKIQWKKIINQLRSLREKEKDKENLNAPFVNDL